MKRLVLIAICLFLVLSFAQVSNADDIKYALSMFHFNIQYVCGGLEGIIPDFLPPFPSWEINADETEDMIVRESFEPIVDLFLAHPGWSVTLEMQGYFLDVLAERHPDVLDKLRVLANSGGAEMVSFHYSDQLFIAYPYEDWLRSAQLTQATFEKHDIPLSKTVFCQEGQAAPGMAAAMEELGYETMVWPKNLWKYQHGDWDADPWYTFGNINMVTGAKGVNDPANGVYMTWTFLGDGELPATGDFDPYFPWFFKHKPAAVAEYEENLQNLANQGYIIGSVADYVADLAAAGIQPTDPPPLLEGTWQPDSTDGTHKWMGGGGLWSNQERDYFVRTAGSIAHRELLGASVMNEFAEMDLDDRLDEAWRLLALGQVTDASGINPFGGEIEYGVAHFAETLRVARQTIDQGKIVLDMEDVIINTQTGSVTEGTKPELQDSPTDPPREIKVSAQGRDVTQTWTIVSPAPVIYKLEIDFGTKPNSPFSQINVRFYGEDGPLQWGSSLIEDSISSIDRSEFVFDWFYLPLPSGLIALGDDWYLVKDTAHFHLAAQVYTDNPDVLFRDETAANFESYKYVFYLVQGAADALDFANALNVTPTLYR